MLSYINFGPFWNALFALIAKNLVGALNRIEGEILQILHLEKYYHHLKRSVLEDVAL